MRNFKRHLILLTGLLFIMLYFALVSVSSQNQTADFEKMRGTRFLHPITDFRADSLSARNIIELRDDNGISSWFCRDFHKVVCLTGECRMIKCRIYWSGTGNFLGINLPANEILTKTDHKPFTLEDYQKLNEILADSNSVLRTYTISNLSRLIKKSENIDAHTGATQSSMSEYVVKDAAYTSFTLWHTVYGTTRSAILSTLEQRADSQYLKKVFLLNDKQNLIWAIDYIKRHPNYHKVFWLDIMNLVKSEDTNLSNKALRYFAPVWIKYPEIQKQLALQINEVSTQTGFEIIWLFSDLTVVTNDALLIFLNQYSNYQLSAGMLGYVCKMIHSDNLVDRGIIKKLKELSLDKNQYVSNMMKNLLQMKNKKIIN
jgi:hypothetical protein